MKTLVDLTSKVYGVWMDKSVYLNIHIHKVIHIFSPLATSEKYTYRYNHFYHLFTTFLPHSFDICPRELKPQPEDPG